MPFHDFMPIQHGDVCPLSSAHCRALCIPVSSNTKGYSSTYLATAAFLGTRPNISESHSENSTRVPCLSGPVHTVRFDEHMPCCSHNWLSSNMHSPLCSPAVQHQHQHQHQTRTRGGHAVSTHAPQLAAPHTPHSPRHHNHYRTTTPQHHPHPLRPACPACGAALNGTRAPS